MTGHSLQTADRADDSIAVRSFIQPRIAIGEISAVEDCLNQYGALVWSIARRWLRNPSDAEDACQEIFIDLWRSANRFAPELGSEIAFVSMIARRRLIDRLRQSKASSALNPEVEFAELEDEHAAVGDRLEIVDEAKKATMCMERLPEDQQKVLKLSIHHGASHATISKRLSIPLGTVKTSARRGLVRIRDCMSRNNELKVKGNYKS